LALLIVLAGLGILGGLVALFLLLLRRLISVPALIALALLISILPLIPLTCAARPTFIALALLVALVRRSVSLALLPSALATFLGALLLLALLAALATALVGLSWSLAASPLIGLTFLSPASAIFLSFASLSARLPVLRQQHLAARNPGRRREFKSRCCTAGYCNGGYTRQQSCTHWSHSSKDVPPFNAPLNAAVPSCKFIVQSLKTKPATFASTD